MLRQGLSLKGRALRLLAGREHSRPELERKLRAHAIEEGKADELVRVLDELEAKGFINPQRVAESLVYRRGARLGASRVKQEMLAKGLEGEVVAEAMQRLKATEPARARAVWEKKFGVTADDAAARAKQMRFLAGRGFAPEVIRQIVSGGGDD